MKVAVFLAVLMLVGALTACGGDENGDDAGNEDFVAQANALCANSSRQLADVALEEGYEMDDQEVADRLEVTLPIRQGAWDQLAELEAPAEQVEGFEAYLESRQEAIDLSEAQIARLENGDTKEVEANAPDVTAAYESATDEASDLGLANCASELPSDDAEAAEDVLRELTITADPATSCNPDALVTETFLEEGMGGLEKCEKAQDINADKLPTDVEVSKVTGVDEIVATLEFEDVGGRYDKVPSTSTLYYVDGGWKVYSLNTLE